MDIAAVPGLIFKLSDTLLKFVPEHLKAKREQADRFAAYCADIARVLEDTAASLRQGRRPHGNCAELDRHMHDALDVLKKAVGEDDLARIGDDLSTAYKIEYLDLAFEDSQSREAAFAQIESAAGRFRALASLLRASGSLKP